MSMDKSLVSVVIPTKNRRALLAEALQSVRAQTYPNWEAIVVDDGSNDGTESVGREIGAADQRVRFVSREREPRGAPACRNIGLSLANGNFILFLDSDDLLAPSCLEARLQAFELEPNLMYV